MLGDHHTLLTRFLIGLGLDGNTFDHVAEFNLTCLLCKNRHVVGIPSYESSTFLNLLTIRDGDNRTDHEVV